MQGTEPWYSTSDRCMINSYKLAVGVLTDGHITIPVCGSFLFTTQSSKCFNPKALSLIELTKSMIVKAVQQAYLSDVTVVADGAYATQEMFSWAHTKNIRLETRIHANRVVEYNGEKISLKKLLEDKRLRPKGRKKGRTIYVLWKGIPLYVTIVRRIDKHGDESFVFIAATYKAEPREHIATYNKRWNIEKVFRTAKQYLGLQDCQSTSLAVQQNHMMAVLVAYAKAELIKKKYKLKNTEAALRLYKERFAFHRKSQTALSIRSFETFML